MAWSLREKEFKNAVIGFILLSQENSIKLFEIFGAIECFNSNGLLRLVNPDKRIS
jgi:hypothetical protein